MSNINSLSATTPYRYAVTISGLLIICIMLFVAGVYFQSYNTLEKQVRQEMTNEKNILQSLPKQKEVIINLYQESQIINLDKPLPAYWQNILQDKIIKLSDKDIEKRYWQQFGLQSGTLVTVVKISDSYMLLTRRLSHRPFLHLLLKSTIYISIIIFGIILIYSSIISSRMLRRIAQIDETARAILSGDQQKRIPIHPNRRDEYTQLSITLNNMLDRMNMLVKDLRQVNNNIAHDLKTPLNRLRSRIEMALLHHKSNNDYEDVLASSIEDIDELLNIFNALLLIGNLESNSRDYQLKIQNVSELLLGLGELYQVIAEEKQHQLNIQIAENIYLFMNSTLFSQAISNLLDNAIKYTPNGGNIDLILKTNQSMATIVIADNGIGIPQQDKEKVFERFSRLDQSRHLPGTGLGMALVKSILKIHHSSINLYDNNPGLRIEIQIRMQDKNNKLA